MNASEYVEILNHYVKYIFFWRVEKLFHKDYNAPCHTARVVQNWFVENSIPKISWPSNSPYLNLIENLWAFLKEKNL